MRFYQSQQNSARGFTLIELMVSVSLFVVVMMVSVGTLLSLVDANRKSQTLKTVTNNLNFALDTMTRTLRTGYDYSCDMDDADVPTDCADGASKITFRDDKGCIVKYAYDGNSIERTISDGTSATCEEAADQKLTSPDVDISDMKFYVTGAADSSDDVQPTVTIVLRGQAGTDQHTETKFNIQTTVTQRLLDL